MKCLLPSIQGECDLTLTAVAATAIMAIAAKPVILRCFVIRTSWLPEPTPNIGQGKFARGSNHLGVTFRLSGFADAFWPRSRIAHEIMAAY
jgi:hypothetical protein